MERHFLERIHLQSFGRFSDMTAGPFGPGLNVVYGKNEAGKSTLNAFVCGVLFGWEDARGSKNVYKPTSAKRAGSLIFAPRAHTAGAERIELSRVRNKDGLKAKPEAGIALMDDIDEETYTTVFALSGDTLRTLGDAGDMTARLLTAGSGTTVGTTEVMEEVERRIAQCTSRAASAPYSFPNLKKRMDSCREQLAEARRRSDEFKDEDRERRELATKRDAVAKELVQANAEAEALAVLKSRIARLKEEEEAACIRRDNAQREVTRYEAAVTIAASAGAGRLSATDEATLREEIQREQENRIRAMQRFEAAQDDFRDARARHDAKKEEAESRDTSRPVAAVVSLILLALIGAAGIAIGVMLSQNLVVAAGVLCLFITVILAVIISAVRRSKAARVEGVVEDAHRTMMEKKSILDSRKEEASRIDARINELLTSAGLSDTEGSLRRAGEIIDEAREARTAFEKKQDRLDEWVKVRDEATALAEQCRAQRSAALVECGFDSSASITEVDIKISQITQNRLSLTEQLEAHSRRLGELDQMLSEAERENSLDLLKTERAQIKTLERESGIELARLLLARQMLSDAVRAWESESQPEVYIRASEIFSLMTGGTWKSVYMEESGALVAVDALGRSWEPRLLSLGTCQQLYLALRIALLECVDSVGASMPVIADDILVSFDDERREGAARALIDLANKRQVIIFTCHQEMVHLLSQGEQDCTLVTL